MEYEVKVGFGRDDEKLRKKFLQTGVNNYDGADIFIMTDMCFARFMQPRIDKKDFHSSDVYYTLNCNLFLLRKIVKWLNELNSGIDVKIIDSTKIGALFRQISTRDDFVFKTTYSKFKFGESYGFLYLEDDKFLKRGGLSIYRCTVKVKINSDNIFVKAFLEYITMCVIRSLDHRESYLRNYNKSKHPIDNAIDISNNKEFGHSLYFFQQNYPAIRTFLKEKDLIFVLNVENMLKAVKRGKGEIENQADNNYYIIRQTWIINFVLERSLNNVF